MNLICPVCRGAVEEAAPRTRHGHEPQRYRHADDQTILCLIERAHEAVVATPVAG